MQHPRKYNYEKHILVCVNERLTGEDHCLKVGGQQSYEKIKKHVKENGLSGRIWVTRTRCLGFCNPIGTTIVVYPEGKWFLEVKETDIDDFIKKEINN